MPNFTDSEDIIEGQNLLLNGSRDPVLWYTKANTWYILPAYQISRVLL